MFSARTSNDKMMLSSLLVIVALAHAEADAACDTHVQAHDTPIDEMALLQLKHGGVAQTKMETKPKNDDLTSQSKGDASDSKQPQPMYTPVAVAAPYGLAGRGFYPPPGTNPLSVNSWLGWYTPAGLASTVLALMATALGDVSAFLATASGLSAMGGWSSGVGSVMLGIYDKYR
eukprot:gnl/TRDRNA2_/TRDRNA2_197283_c0_seq1.p1 gnl/TRDRNA2_/TRDRNA2_197283_c0~~gnl/TRDRNA2_/TRDRNA2_197283_c0_seq1.p1  ORF type:complete len:174 (-),score=16.73 gnl/TRDRNA2_/TRDRNA2_197283_c0_seq1:128-649(-)